MTDNDAHDLFQAALEVRAHAHAPYSNFPVGVALRTDTGEIFAGCNVENGSYPEGACAETGAISAMVAGGGRTIVEVCVVGASEHPLTPCGGCRQRIAEFGSRETLIHAASPDAGIRATWRLDELLPEAFRLEVSP